MDVDPPHKIDIVIERSLYPGGNSITFGHAQRAIDPDGNVDHQIRTETMGVNLFDLFHFRDVTQQFDDAFGQRAAGNRVHQVVSGVTHYFDPRFQDDQGHQRPGQRVDPGITQPAQQDTDRRRQRGKDIVAVIGGQGQDRRVLGFCTNLTGICG